MDPVVAAKLVMPGLVPDIHILAKDVMTGTSPAMTKKASPFQAVREGSSC
jgi:hypothetical protein